MSPGRRIVLAGVIAACLVVVLLLAVRWLSPVPPESAGTANGDPASAPDAAPVEVNELLRRIRAEREAMDAAERELREAREEIDRLQRELDAAREELERRETQLDEHAVTE